jgi:hypothetical protein
VGDLRRARRRGLTIAPEQARRFIFRCAW